MCVSQSQHLVEATFPHGYPVTSSTLATSTISHCMARLLFPESGNSTPDKPLLHCDLRFMPSQAGSLEFAGVVQRFPLLWRYLHKLQTTSDSSLMSHNGM
jgi:hypothetical protein